MLYPVHYFGILKQIMAIHPRKAKAYKSLNDREDLIPTKTVDSVALISDNHRNA
jgi:hypothetical protein